MSNYFSKLTGWCKHSTFGLRKEWLELYLEHPHDWQTKGLLGNKQVEALEIWLKTAGLHNNRGGETRLCVLFRENGLEHPLCWQLLWVEVVFHFAVAEWYVRELGLGLWTTTEMKQRLHQDCPRLSPRTLNNAVIELASLLERTPVGKALGQGDVSSSRPRRIARKGLPFPSHEALFHAMCHIYQREQRQSLDLTDNLLWPWTVFGCESHFVIQEISLSFPGWFEIQGPRVTFVGSIRKFNEYWNHWEGLN